MRELSGHLKKEIDGAIEETKNEGHEERRRNSLRDEETREEANQANGREPITKDRAEMGPVDREEEEHEEMVNGRWKRIHGREETRHSPGP